MTIMRINDYYYSQKVQIIEASCLRAQARRFFFLHIIANGYTKKVSFVKHDGAKRQEGQIFLFTCYRKSRIPRLTPIFYNGKSFC